MMPRTTLSLIASILLFSAVNGQEADRKISFPDIPGFLTLKCDLHMHTVLSDGSVWPDIRVQEALRDGLDVISITDHLEYQPHKEDIPHPDRNRGYELALKAAGNSGLIIINGTEITRSMPPGHANAIFVKDVNAMLSDDYMHSFREAKKQGAFIFWNHPHWTAQQSDGVATLQDLHREMIEEGLIHGIEIYNEYTYSDEALEIAGEQGLTILGTSDIHGLIDYQFNVAEGGHRPVTLVFAAEKSPEALKEALFAGQTAVWFDNTLVGSSEYLAPLLEASIKARAINEGPVRKIWLENSSDISCILENTGPYRLHNQAKTLTVKAHEKTLIQVKCGDLSGELELPFKVLNAISAPDEQVEIIIPVKAAEN